MPGMYNPAPMIGTIQCTLGLADQPNMNRETGMKTPAMQESLRYSSGGTLKLRRANLGPR